jgi:hypothetical protein
MLKKQATSAEDPKQEDEDAAGAASVEEIGPIPCPTGDFDPDCRISASPYFAV